MKVGDQVIHRLDPLNRLVVVVKTFNWIGQRKLVAIRSDGERLKDYEYEFISPKR